MITKIIAIQSIVFLFFTSSCLAISFPFQIKNDTSKETCATPVNLSNGKIIKVTNKPQSTVIAYIENPEIRPGAVGIMDVTLEGHDQGQIIFQYNVQFLNAANHDAEQGILNVTYDTGNISVPQVNQIPPGLTFYYDPSFGYKLTCQEN